VTFHRGNIRQKLGMHGSPERLASKVSPKQFSPDDQGPERGHVQEKSKRAKLTRVRKVHTSSGFRQIGATGTRRT
jgi:hypothetical protein